MSGVIRNIRNIDPPPPHRPASVYPAPLVRGEDTLAEWRGGEGSIVRKTPDTAVYSIYVSTLWKIQNKNPLLYPLPSHVPPSLPSIPVFPNIPTFLQIFSSCYSCRIGAKSLQFFA